MNTDMESTVAGVTHVAVPVSCMGSLKEGRRGVIQASALSLTLIAAYKTGYCACACGIMTYNIRTRD